MIGRPGAYPWVTGAAAFCAAVAVFAVDTVAGFDVSVAILYAVVLAIAALGQGERGILLAASGCVLLAGMGWAMVHGSSPDLASLLRLLFATTAICLTCALLVGRKKLQALREALEGSRAELLDFNATLEHRVEQRTADLLRTEARYASLFEVSSITFAEQDPGEAIAIVADLKRRSVTDLAAHFARHPALLDRCVAAFRTVRVNSACARMLGYDSVEELVAVPRPPRSPTRSPRSSCASSRCCSTIGNISRGAPYSTRATGGSCRSSIRSTACPTNASFRAIST